MSGTEMLEHVVRRAFLPWRPPEKLQTECGRMADDLTVITFDEFMAKVKRQGRQRASMSTCMTCWHTAPRYKSWDDDPIDAIRREVWNMRNESLLRKELQVIAALVANHRSEFDAYMGGLDEVTNLASRRKRGHGR